MPRSMSSLRMVLLESCRPVVLGKISSDRLAGAPCGAKVRPLTGEFWASWRIMRSHEASKLWSWGESNPRPSSGCRLRYDHSRSQRCGLRAVGSAALAGSAGSFSGVSGLSRRQRSFPAVLLCFCCQAAADRPRVPPWGSQLPHSLISRSSCEEHGFIIAVSCGAPFLESEQLRSRSTVPGLDVETDQPLVNVRYASLYRAPATSLGPGSVHSGAPTGEPPHPLSPSSARPARVHFSAVVVRRHYRVVAVPVH